MGSHEILASSGFHFSLLIFNSCGIDVEDPTPPSPPQWVEKSLPEEWPERGIDAHESGGIYLEWEPNTEDNILANLIYRAEYFDDNDSLGQYEQIDRLEASSNATLEYVDTDLKVRTQYYYKLKSADLSENRSDFSDSLCFGVLPQISIGTMAPNGLLDSLNKDMKLYWRYTYSVEMEDYCLTMVNQNGDYIFREVFTPGNYLDGTESREIPESVTLVPGQIYRWRVDTAARYENDVETAGSESNWATFVFPGF